MFLLNSVDFSHTMPLLSLPLSLSLSLNLLSDIIYMYGKSMFIWHNSFSIYVKIITLTVTIPLWRGISTVYDRWTGGLIRERRVRLFRWPDVKVGENFDLSRYKDSRSVTLYIFTVRSERLYLLFRKVYTQGQDKEVSDRLPYLSWTHLLAPLPSVFLLGLRDLLTNLNSGGAVGEGETDGWT